MILYERYRGVEVFMQKTYLCIDLKSFYASVECVELGLDPFEVGSLTLAHSQNSQMSFMYGFFFVKFLFLLLYVL